MKIACLIPTLYRKNGLVRVLSSLHETAPSVHAVVVSEVDDFEAPEVAEQYGAYHVTCKNARQGPAYAWNTGLSYKPDYDAYFLGSDDIEFTTNWLGECLYVLREELYGSGLVGCNDGNKDSLRIKRNKVQPTQIFMTRDFIIQYNGGVVAIPHYRVDFTDYESCIRARNARKFAYAENSLVKHHWRILDDNGYRTADNYRKQMKTIYKERMIMGFPNDFMPILKEGVYAT